MKRRYKRSSFSSGQKNGNLKKAALAFFNQDAEITSKEKSLVMDEDSTLQMKRQKRDIVVVSDADENGVGTSRRSGRNRTPSKWLQDMEVNFGTRKGSRKPNGERTDRKSCKRIRKEENEDKNQPYISIVSQSDLSAKGRTSKNNHDNEGSNSDIVAQQNEKISKMQTQCDSAEIKSSDKDSCSTDVLDSDERNAHLGDLLPGTDEVNIIEESKKCQLQPQTSEISSSKEKEHGYITDRPTVKEDTEPEIQNKIRIVDATKFHSIPGMCVQDDLSSQAVHLTLNVNTRPVTDEVTVTDNGTKNIKTSGSHVCSGSEDFQNNESMKEQKNIEFAHDIVSKIFGTDMVEAVNNVEEAEEESGETAQEKATCKIPQHNASIPDTQKMSIIDNADVVDALQQEMIEAAGREASVQQEIIEAAGQQQVIEAAGQQQMIEAAGQQQMIEAAGQQQMIEAAGQQQMIEAAGQQQMIEAAGQQQTVELQHIQLLAEEGHIHISAAVHHAQPFMSPRQQQDEMAQSSVNEADLVVDSSKETSQNYDGEHMVEKSSSQVISDVPDIIPAEGNQLLQQQENNGVEKTFLNVYVEDPNKNKEDTLTEEYCCSDCDYRTEKKANWYKHRKKHTGSRPYTCTYENCSYKATTSSNLKRHLLTHTDQKTFKCSICNTKFRQKIHLERHIKYKHEEKRVQCKLCDYVCANYNPDLKIHMKRRHQSPNAQNGPITENAPTFSCPHCAFAAISKRDLKQHLKFHRNGPELKLFCEQCSFVTDCESRLTRHWLTHTKEKPFACGLCTYRATQKEHVIRHMQTKHGIEIVKTRRLKSKIEKPSGSDIEANNSSCMDKLPATEQQKIQNEASVTFRRYEPADFTDSEKMFSCNYCTMKFAKLLNLYKHMQIQHKDANKMVEEEGIYSCIVCSFKTPKKKNLLVHMRKHNFREDDEFSGNQVFSCMLCNYTNSRRKNLYIHMKKRHNMQILIRDDGGTRCFLQPQNSTSLLSTQTLQQIATVADQTGDLQQSAPQVAVSISSDAGEIMQGLENAELQQIQHVPGSGEIQTVVLETAPDGTTVLIDTSSDVELSHMDGTVVDDEAVDAIEGLQALAQQGSQTSTVENSQQELSAQDDIQLTEEQIMELSSGDYIEINGEMYKVEFTSQEKS